MPTTPQAKPPLRVTILVTTTVIVTGTDGTKCTVSDEYRQENTIVSEVDQCVLKVAETVIGRF